MASCPEASRPITRLGTTLREALRGRARAESGEPMRAYRAGAVVFLAALAILTIGLLRSAHAQLAADDPAAVDARAPIPTSPAGDLVRYGRSLITQTPKYAGQYITAGMSCAACHINGGTQPHGGSFLGVYAKFPEWSERAKRFITLADRLDECFLYSMNGRPPPPYSREIVAMTAYIAWLSRGAAVGEGFPNQGFVTVRAPQSPSKENGAKIYAAQCTACHGAAGGGNAAANFPPLWGPESVNDGAG